MYSKEKYLLEALRKGEKAAYEELFSRFWTKTVRYLTYILKDSGTAEDLAQNVFLKIWEKRGGLSEVRSLDSFVFTIAHNEACDYLRRTRTEPIRDDLQENLLYSQQIRMDEDKINDIVKDCVGNLPEQRRTCYVMSREEHLSNQEIADRLGLSRRTVEHHISFALKAIREALGRNFS